MYQALFREIGLTNSEIKVYLALIQIGSSSKGAIVERAGVASSKVYELLAKLINKGLVSTVIKSGVKYFEAAPAHRLLDYVQEKERTLERYKSELVSIIPDLERVRAHNKGESETQVFKGMQGAATSFDDILRELEPGDEYYVLGISKFTPHFERFIIRFHKKRAKKGIRCKIIVNELARDIGKKLEPIPKTKVRYLQAELFTPVVFILYKNKTLISVGLDEIFIQVQSKNLADGLRAYADYMWKLAK